MPYSLKDKISVTAEFLNELISKSWQETETLQQQIANIDTNTKLGSETVKYLKNACTNYYILIGCLEALVENPNTAETEIETDAAIPQNTVNAEAYDEPYKAEANTEEMPILPTVPTDDFEPFEYFVDFDEPSGTPITDTDLYG